MRVHPCRLTLKQGETLPAVKTHISEENVNDNKSNEATSDFSEDDNDSEEETENIRNSDDEVSQVSSDDNIDPSRLHEEVSQVSSDDNTNSSRLHEDVTKTSALKRGRPPKGSNNKKNGESTAKNIKKGMEIQYKTHGEDNWKTLKVVSRSGKYTGKYPNECNMQIIKGRKR